VAFLIVPDLVINKWLKGKRFEASGAVFSFVLVSRFLS
jgi:hypothetical protein